MNIQSQLNKEAIESTPILHSLIKHAAQFEKNQMINFTLREIMNSPTALDKMDELELAHFQVKVASTFFEKGWIKN